MAKAYCTGYFTHLTVTNQPAKIAPFVTYGIPIRKYVVGEFVRIQQICLHINCQVASLLGVVDYTLQAEI